MSDIDNSRAATVASSPSSLSITEIRVSSIAFWILAAMLCSDMLAGPLRYYLFKVHLDSIIYLPKVAGLLFVIFEMVRRQIDRQLFHILVFLGIFSVIAFIHQVGIAPQLFTLFLIAPFLFGVVAARYLHDAEDAFVTLMAIVFLVTAVGVFLDIPFDYPWKGFVYSVGDAEIEGARDWTTMGFERVAGFTRLSAAAAFYLVCSVLFLYRYTKSWVLKMAMLVVAFPAVLATTNKAGIGGLVLGMGSIFLASLPRLQKLYTYGLSSIVMLLPFSTVFRTYDLNLADPVSVILFASFEDRLIETWPGFISAVSAVGNPLVGVGFGGAGSAAKYFSQANLRVLAIADNFATYLYGCFGVAAVFLLFYFARVALTLFASRDRLSSSLAPVMVAALAASLTTDVIEAQVFAVMLGITVAVANDCGRKTEPPGGLS